MTLPSQGDAVKVALASQGNTVGVTLSSQGWQKYLGLPPSAYTLSSSVYSTYGYLHIHAYINPRQLYIQLVGFICFFFVVVVVLSNYKTNIL